MRRISLPKIYMHSYCHVNAVKIAKRMLLPETGTSGSIFESVDSIPISRDVFALPTSVRLTAKSNFDTM